MSDVILQEKTGDGILILTLNKPEAMNCLNFEMIETLQKVIEEANFDMSIRVFIITVAAPPEGKKASRPRIRSSGCFCSISPGQGSLDCP